MMKFIFVDLRVNLFSSFQLNKHMEKCMAGVNANLLKHKLMIAVDDRGKLSCHKVNLCFIYIEPTECIVSVTQIDRSLV